MSRHGTRAKISIKRKCSVHSCMVSAHDILPTRPRRRKTRTPFPLASSPSLLGNGRSASPRYVELKRHKSFRSLISRDDSRVSVQHSTRASTCTSRIRSLFLRRSRRCFPSNGPPASSSSILSQLSSRKRPEKTSKFSHKGTFAARPPRERS